MQLSVDDAVASLYPFCAVHPLPNYNSIAVSPEDDEAWVSSVFIQKALLELPAGSTYGTDAKRKAPSIVLDNDFSLIHPFSQHDNSGEKAAPQTQVIRMPNTQDFDDTVKDMFQDLPMNQSLTVEASMAVCSEPQWEQHSWEQQNFSEAAHRVSSPEMMYDMKRSSRSSSMRTSPGDRPRRNAAGNNDGQMRFRNVRPWASDEHERFLMALNKFRTNETERFLENGFQSTGLGPGIADLIAMVVRTRDAAQVRSHAQKHFQRLRREAQKAAKTEA